jgi:hypothetical protein
MGIYCALLAFTYVGKNHCSPLSYINSFTGVASYYFILFYAVLSRSITITTSERRFAYNSAGTEEFPDDGTQVPKHVRAAELYNKLLRISAFVGSL